MMVALIGVNTNLLKRGFDLSNSVKFMIQVNSLLKDVVVLLNSKSKLIKDASTLFVLTNTLWTINDNKASLSVNVDIKSYARVFNINRLKKDTDQTINNSIYDIISVILTKYNVADPEYFLNLVLDSIDLDINERAYESEIVLLNPDFEQGLILSMRQFQEIILFYKKKTGDYSIDLVPWGDIIGFGGDAVDINYVSKELLAYILPIPKDEIVALLNENRPINSINALFSVSEVKLLDKLHIKTFVPIVRCFVDIDVFGKSAKAMFTYNLESKRVTDVSILTAY